MSIKQKHIETRSWGTAYRGPVALHAAKKWGTELRRLCLMPPFCDALFSNETPWETPDDLPRGCVVAVGSLHRCLSTNQYRGAIPAEHTREYDFGDYSPNRFMWVFDKIWKLREPIELRGQLMLCDLDEAETDTVLTMLPDGVEGILRGEED